VDYFSDDEEVFPEDQTECRQMVLGAVTTVLTWPVYISFLFSFYSVCALVATFVATVLTAYALAPVSAALERDSGRFAVAMVSVYTSVPVVVIVAFFFVKMFGALVRVVIDFVISVITDLWEQGSRINRDFSIQSLWPFLIVKIPLIAIGAVFFWLTCFVDGWILIMGFIPFASVAISLLTNFFQAAVAFCALFISPLPRKCPRLTSDSGSFSLSSSSSDSKKPASQEVEQGLSDMGRSLIKKGIKLAKERTGPPDENHPRAWGLHDGEPAISPLTSLMLGLDYFWSVITQITSGRPPTGQNGSAL
jgi:hypothetical protein